MKANQVAEKSDREWAVEFLCQGDETAFRALYRRHTPALYALALRLYGGSEASAQDAIQDTWLRACKGLSGFEWRSSLRTWLTGILVNRVREVSRERRHRDEEELSDEYPEKPALSPSVKVDLERAISLLPTGYRHVLLLHDLEGYTHEEIGRLLGVNAGTSRSQLHHARQALRAMLAPNRQEDGKDG